MTQKFEFTKRILNNTRTHLIWAQDKFTTNNLSEIHEINEAIEVLEREGEK